MIASWYNRKLVMGLVIPEKINKVTLFDLVYIFFKLKKNIEHYIH